MKNKTDAHRIRIIRPGIRKPRFGILKISDNKKKLIQQLLILIMSVIIWSIFNLCPLIPVTHSASDSGYSEQFATQETLPYVVYHGFHWTHYGRVGWCGVEPPQHWTHFADPIISFLFINIWVPMKNKVTKLAEIKKNL